MGASHLCSKGFDALRIFQGYSDVVSSGEEVGENSFFDVASLTKPLVTLLVLLALIKERKIAFTERLGSLLPHPVPADKKDIRLIDLISHRSGLPAHRNYFEHWREKGKTLDRAMVVDMILGERLEHAPGQTYVYSDLDYLLLGDIIAWKSGQAIEQYWQEKITDPLGITEMFHAFGNQPDREISFVSTGKCRFFSTPLRGVVHDENCRAMGTIQGHAGLFSTLEGIMALCEDLILNYLGERINPFYKREDLLYLLRMRDKKQWAYGFDVVTGTQPSSGNYFSRRTIGHLGYTGTSFWIDLEKKAVVVFLTNRVVHGDDNSRIREMRPRLHDAVMKYLALT